MKPIKLKPLTSEIIEETSNLCGEDIKAVRRAFHHFWDDIQIIFTRGLCWSVNVPKFGTFYLNMRIHSLMKKKEKKIMLLHRTYLKNRDHRVYRKEHVKKIVLDRLMHDFFDGISEVVLIYHTLKAYENEIRSQYPKKYKADIKTVEATLERIQKLVNLPLSEFPVTTYHPIQKIYVQKLSKEGILRNPVIHKDKKV